MSYAAVTEDNRLIALMTAPADVQEYATLLDGTAARALAATRVLRCGSSGCSAPLFYREGEEIAPHFYHLNASAAGCEGFTGSAGAWHLRMQYEVFKNAFAHEWRMQSAIADVVIRRKNTQNRFAVEVQHSPIDRETILARHAAHRAAGMMGTIWIVDGSALKKGLRVHKSWVIDLLKACMDTPAAYPCTVLVYKDRRDAGGTETVSIIDSVELGHEADGRRYAQANLVKKNGTAVRFQMDALGFLAQGPDRSNVIPLSLAGLQPQLDSLPTRRVKDALKIAA
ncbi:hypothetical protein [Arthrobacter sp. STN4]|uniref:competence protein CoiA family protein n=1 Tax=Arthrobacter sp. STN4 TaxID=2923276 RepID=UPI00211A336E|nr:hypothetical protein [Arthrobacter sp. STN4]MCQ9162947.1 hypothetical protein [Arthrobacter sp. STN4]